jgi:hypothetical protein
LFLNFIPALINTYYIPISFFHFSDGVSISLLRSVSALLNFHFEHCILPPWERQISSLFESAISCMSHFLFLDWTSIHFTQNNWKDFVLTDLWWVAERKTHQVKCEK